MTSLLNIVSSSVKRPVRRREEKAKLDQSQCCYDLMLYKGFNKLRLLSFRMIFHGSAEKVSIIFSSKAKLSFCSAIQKIKTLRFGSSSLIMLQIAFSSNSIDFRNLCRLLWLEPDALFDEIHFGPVESEGIIIDIPRIRTSETRESPVLELL